MTRRGVLRELLTNRLDLGELEVLCADIDAALVPSGPPRIRVRVDDLGGPTLGLAVLADRLIARLHRHGRLNVLLDQLRQRPDLASVVSALPETDDGIHGEDEDDQNVAISDRPPVERSNVVVAGVIALALAAGAGALIAWAPVTRLPLTGRLPLLMVTAVAMLFGVAMILLERLRPLSRRGRFALAMVASLAAVAAACWFLDVAVTRHAVRVTHDWCPGASAAVACFVVRPPAGRTVDIDVTLFVADRTATKVTRWRPGLVNRRDGPPWVLRRDTEDDFSALVRSLQSPARFEVEYEITGRRTLLVTNVLIIAPDVPVLHADDLAAWRRWFLLGGGVLWLIGVWFLYSSPSWLPRWLPRRRRGTTIPAPSWTP